MTTRCQYCLHVLKLDFLSLKNLSFLFNSCYSLMRASTHLFNPIMILFLWAILNLSLNLLSFTINIYFLIIRCFLCILNQAIFTVLLIDYLKLGKNLFDSVYFIIMDKSFFAVFSRKNFTTRFVSIPTFLIWYKRFYDGFCSFFKIWLK